MIRVTDIEKSAKFYTEGFGMKVLDRFDVESRRVSAMYVGFDGYAAGGVVELVQAWDRPANMTHPEGYAHHFAIGVPDVPAMIAKLESLGGEVSLKPTIMKPGAPAAAFVKDPDGYSIELIQTRAA
jgi:lactoylglutathione lyase